MRKASLVIILVLCSICFSSCGSDEVPANAIVEPTSTIETGEPSEDTTPIETPIDEPDESVVDEGVLNVDDSSEGEFSLGDYDKEGVRHDYTSQLQEKGYVNEAWSEEHLFPNAPELAFYISHFVDANGASMNFSWIGPIGIGNAWAIATDGGGFYLMDKEKAEEKRYDFMMFPSGTWVDDSPIIKSTDAQSLMEWALATPFEETYQVEEDSQFYRVTYKVNYVEDGVSYTGYACLIDNYDLKESYIFRYVVEDSIFDETMVYASIESIVPANLEDFDITLQE